MSHGDGRLLLGDCLETAADVEPASLDVIYIDPPFATGKRRERGGRAYDDLWRAEDPAAYLQFLEPRLAALRELLKDTGSMFVHLDTRAVHAVKLRLDHLFGPRRFINEIIWCYKTGGAGRRALARKHDTILFYAKTTGYRFYPQKEKSYLRHRYGFANVQIHEDRGGPYTYATMRDVWDIPALRGNQPECVGYPTQKPLALVERCLELTTRPGDLVGDFFCGSGTTAVAAQKLDRRWVVGDLSPEAIAMTRRRLAFPLTI